jgi:DNA-binding Lrp family transcriptional regulator
MHAVTWIASRSLSSGAHSRDPLARNDGPSYVRHAKASPDVLECHHIAGAWSYLLKVWVGATRDLDKYLSDAIKSLDGVERTETLITLFRGRRPGRSACRSGWINHEITGGAVLSTAPPADG